MALVVFLRGVNVGGFRSFRPTMLARELEEYDLVNFGAAGTFVVRKSVSQRQLRSEVLQRLPFEAEVIICTGRELIEATSIHPFEDKTSRPDIVRFVSVLKRPPRAIAPLPIRIPEARRWLVKILRVRGKFVLGEYRREMKAISCLAEIDKMFGMPATTRSWNTIRAVLKALKKVD